jgi:hypothetical protein
VTRLGVSEAGVDTISIAFRPEREAALDALRATRHREGPQGSLVLDQRGPDGGRVIGWPGYGVIAYEGRLGALLAGDEGDHSLQPSASVRAGATAARAAIADVIGVDPGARAEVRRFDLASELRFAERWEGVAFLRTCEGMCPPKAQVVVHRADDGTPMTVYVKTPQRGQVVNRIYDKGRESGSDPSGLRIRLESQNRPKKAKRWTPDVFAGLDLSPTFGRTMSHYLKHEQVVTAGPDAAVTRLIGKAASGELTVARAERLAGAVAFLKAAGRAAYEDPSREGSSRRRPATRRLKALRDAGISLDYDLPSESVVPVGQLLSSAIERFTV